MHNFRDTALKRIAEVFPLEEKEYLPDFAPLVREFHELYTAYKGGKKNEV